MLLWDVPDGKVNAVLPGAAGHVFSLAFSPDGALLAAADREAIRLWDVKRAGILATIELKSGLGDALAFDRQGRLVCGSAQNRRLYVWDVERQWPRTVASYPIPGEISSCVLSTDGRLLAFRDSAGAVHVLELSDDELRSRSVIKPEGGGSPRRFSPDGSILVLATWGQHPARTGLWKTETGERIRDWRLPGATSDLLFTPDGRWLVTANQNGTIYLFRVPIAQTPPERR